MSNQGGRGKGNTRYTLNPLHVIVVPLSYCRLLYPMSFTPSPSYIETRLLHFFTQLHTPYILTPQFKIGPYYVDLCHEETKSVCECDGEQYHSSPEQVEHDRRRQEFIEKQGYKVIRFTGKEIYHYPMQCAYKLRALIENRLH